MSGRLHVLGRHESKLLVHSLLLLLLLLLPLHLPLHLLRRWHKGQRLILRLQRCLHHPARATVLLFYKLFSLLVASQHMD